MKRASLLTLSLLCNGLLIVTLLVAVARGNGRGRPPGFSRDVTNRSLRISPPVSQPVPANADSPPVVVNEPFHWSRIESSDYRVYVQNLREVGCPESTIKDMITAEISELFSGRMRDLVNPYVPQFWNLLSNKESFEALVEAKAKELKDLDEQRTDMLRLLLGRDGQDFVEDDNEAGEAAEAERRRQFYDFLPLGKRDQMIALEEKYRVLFAEVHNEKSKGEEKQRRLAELNEAKKLEWSQLLTPGEVAEMRMRTSRHAELRYRLAGFRASEDNSKPLWACTKVRRLPGVEGAECRCASGAACGGPTPPARSVAGVAGRGAVGGV